LKDKVIHKAKRPKGDYNNPVLCHAGIEAHARVWQRNKGEAYPESRTSWSAVTCKNCLKMKKE